MFKRIFHILAVLALTGALLAVHGTPAAAQSSLDKLSVHGFMTQAYGISDGDQRLGIPAHGTADYRVAALQFRYDPSDRDAFLIQFSHERIGHSPLSDLEPAVDLDWVFYERRFGENTVARVGKIRSPIGIYNEIRDVGTLLPLYRPPVTMYGEQMYSSETVDGVMVGHYVPLGDWSLDVEAFFGSWEYLQWDLTSFAHVDNGLGTQLWLRTPIQGLRVGASAIRYTSRDVMGYPEGYEDTSTLILGSVDGTFSRFFVRAEAYTVGFGDEAILFEGTAKGYYAQGGAHLTDAVSLIAQAEFTDLEFDVTEPQYSFDEMMDRDLGLGIQYRYSPNLVLKLEAHQYRGWGIENRLILAGIDEPATMTYGLFSVSTSF
jgi:hypothetical protein